MRSYSITRALRLPQYRIRKIFSETDQEIHIEAVPYKRKPIVCSGCGLVHEKGRHGVVEIVVEDLRLAGRRVYLHVVKRRARCPEDGCIHVESIDWIKPRARVTNRFAEEVYRLTAITTNMEAGWYLGMDDEQIYYQEAWQLFSFLAHKHKRRRLRFNHRKPQQLPIPCRTPMSRRPEAVNQRLDFGRWEADSMVSKQSLAQSTCW